MFATYARFLRLYPRAFRERFADEMLQTLRDRLAYEGRVGWARTYTDLFGSVVIQRTKETVVKIKVWPVAFGLALALLVTRVVIGSGWSIQTLAIMLLELAAAGIVIGIATLIGRHTRGAEFDYAKRRLRWWWIPAGLIGATETAFAIGTIVTDPTPTHVFVFFLQGGFATLIFAGMAIRNRRIGNYMIAAGALPMLPIFWLIAPTIVGLLVIVMALSDNARMVQPQLAV